MNKVSRIVAVFGLIAVLIGSAVALAATDEIRDRIRPSGDVRLGEGAQRAVAERADRDGQTVYAAACQACHASGAAGAPRTGRAADWGERAQQDMATLYDHAINGIGSMPGKGGCRDCSDTEVEKAVDYMMAELE
ncbi:MAG: cytochrome c5 family protein [Halomonadaceae bacterium]|nr:MAG: cytochrome c5 family protein [Halomonadaceae bacterium]